MQILFSTKTPRPLSFALASFLFSSVASTTRNALSLFLLNECHFSSSQISKIMKTEESLLRTRSPDSAREAVEFLRGCGFTQTQLHHTILQYPNVLTRRVDRQLKPLFDILIKLGFDGQNLPVLVSKYPRMLGCSLEKNWSSRIPFLQNLLGSKRNMFNVLRRAPELLVQSVEKQLKPKIDFFKQRGIEGESLLSLLSRNQSILSRASIQLLQTREEYVVNTMGITKGSKSFAYAMAVLVKITPENVEKKIKHLQSLGILEDEVHQLMRKAPWSLDISTKKMQENMEFLTYTAGLQPNVVLSYTDLLRYSVDKRLKPRLAVVRALRGMQEPIPCLPTIFRISEQKFLQKFVECNPQASMLKVIYQGKVNAMDVETT